MDALFAGSFRAAIYCRLSKDDDLDGTSASIENQRDMLEKFCEKQGWEVAAVYQDDGFTGLNMERPDLKRMLKAIERKQINLVITKDLSTNHEGLSQPIMKIRGAGSTTVLASCLDL